MIVRDYNSDRVEDDHLLLHKIVGSNFIMDSDLQVLKRKWEDDNRVWIFGDPAWGNSEGNQRKRNTFAESSVSEQIQLAHEGDVPQTDRAREGLREECELWAILHFQHFRERTAWLLSGNLLFTMVAGAVLLFGDFVPDGSAALGNQPLHSEDNEGG